MCTATQYRGYRVTDHCVILSPIQLRPLEHAIKCLSPRTMKSRHCCKPGAQVTRTLSISSLLSYTRNCIAPHTVTWPASKVGILFKLQHLLMRCIFVW